MYYLNYFTTSKTYINTMKNLLLFYFILHFFNNVYSQTPGGVSSGTLSGWFDANTGITLNGGAVSGWQNRAGIGDATQATAGERPIQTIAATNYNAALIFDGNNDNLDLADRMANTATALSVFAVAKQTATNRDSWGSIINGQVNGPSWTGGGYGLVALNDGNTSFGCYVRDWNTKGASFATTLSIPTVMGGVWNGTTANAVEYFQNGSSKSTVAYTPGSVGDNGSTWIGSGDGANSDWSFYGDINEVIVFNSGLSSTNALRVMSYLAIKYGVTLTSNYLNSAGTNLFTNSATYTANIIGISRDDQSSLNQKQSKNNDDSVRIYLSTLAATNSANTGSTTDLSAVMIGSNTGKLCSSIASNAEKPASVSTRITREWKVTNTAFSSTFSLDIKLNNCAFTSSVNIADLRLLVDDDGNFANATVFSSGGGLTFSYSNPILTISGISTTQIASNTTKYITIASVAATTPLPVELIDFNGNSEESYNSINWVSASEVNFKHYELESSADGTTFSKITTVAPLSNVSSYNTYNYLDFNYFKPNTYYRLKIIDLDGSFEYSNIIAINNINLTDYISDIIPNPTNDFIRFDVNTLTKNTITAEITDNLGKVLITETFKIDDGGYSSINLNLSELNSGMYYLKVVFKNSSKTEIKKIIKN